MRGLVSPGPREEVRGTFSQSRLDGRNPRGCQNLEAWFDDPHQLLPSRITLAVALGNAVLLGFVSLKISMLFSTPGGGRFSHAPPFVRIGILALVQRLSLGAVSETFL